MREGNTAATRQGFASLPSAGDQAVIKCWHTCGYVSSLCNSNGLNDCL